MAVGYTSFTPPSGNIAPSLRTIEKQTNFDAPFTVAATFSGTCGEGEYRQYAKGVLKVNGSTLDFTMCGTIKLQPDVFHEDGCPPTVCTAYGYRTCPAHPYNQYTPDRSTGCQFQSYDAPGFKNVVKGSTYNLDVTFQGTLIDVARGGAVLVSNTWTTTGSTTVTETPVAMAAVGFDKHDRIIGVHLTHNSESGAPELHVVIVRPPGRPPLDAAAMKLEMLDTTGRRATPQHAPAVHEVGNLTRSTVSIVYTLAPGEMPPARVELAMNGGVVKMKVEQR
jgi:hypothetical protein